MTEYMLIKNNGMAKINEKEYPNCCLFISLGVIWRTVKRDDFILHYTLFVEQLNREITPEEMVYYILKVREKDLVEKPGIMQIDTLVEKFVNYTNIKISMMLAENNMKFDLFKDNDQPEAIIIQYPNHFECAIPKKFIQQ